jgi:hypothetical protein
VTEAAWIKTLEKYYKRWPVEELLKRLGTAEAVLQERKDTLRDACYQVFSV